MVTTISRRTTIIVSDMKTSRGLYEGILGMTPYWDDDFRLSGDGLPAEEPNALTRLCILKCQDPHIGMIGLLQFIDPPLKKVERPPKQVLGAGDFVLHMDVDDIDAVHDAINTQGLGRCMGGPHNWEVGMPDGSVRQIRTLNVFDPDDHFLQLNQPLS